MSTSEQHDTRHDTLSGEQPLVEDEYAADEPRDGVVDFSDQRRADGDSTYASDDTAHTDAQRSSLADEEPLVSDSPAADDSHARTDGTVTDDLEHGDTTDVATVGAANGSTATGSTATASTDAAATPDRAPLVSSDRADSYASRWNEVKGMFVDEPRQAVQKADQLVGELLDDLERGFREQRQGIEHGLDNDDTSTEDLRMALRRYRSFFDRLLSV